MHAGRLARLWRLREDLGPLYGSENLSLLLYTLARREKWANMVELGTGLGVCTVWLGRAAQDNGLGHVHSVDDGSHFQNMPSSIRRQVLRAVTARTTLAGPKPCAATANRPIGYERYLQRIDRMAGVADRITHYGRHLDLDRLEHLSSTDLPFLAIPIDMLFTDIDHGPAAILAILRRFLPSMSTHGSIFIDGASEHASSRRLLDQLVAQMNRARVPSRLSEGMPAPRTRRLGRLVRSCRFTLVHLVERERRPQNNTAWILIAPAPTAGAG